MFTLEQERKTSPFKKYYCRKSNKKMKSVPSYNSEIFTQSNVLKIDNIDYKNYEQSMKNLDK